VNTSPTVESITTSGPTVELPLDVADEALTTDRDGVELELACITARVRPFDGVAHPATGDAQTRAQPSANSCRMRIDNIFRAPEEVNFDHPTPMSLGY
jgi:hypothetical protein